VTWREGPEAGFWNGDYKQYLYVINKQATSRAEEGRAKVAEEVGRRQAAAREWATATSSTRDGDTGPGLREKASADASSSPDERAAVKWQSMFT